MSSRVVPVYTSDSRGALSPFALRQTMGKKTEILVDGRGDGDKGWTSGIHLDPKKNVWDVLSRQLAKRPAPEHVYKRPSPQAADQSDHAAPTPVSAEAASTPAPATASKAPPKRSGGGGGFRGLVWSMVVPLQLSLFLYEYLAWQVDTEYTAVGEFAKEELGPMKYFLLVQAVSWPHLVGAYAFSQRIVPLMMLYFLGLVAFLGLQLQVWWLPYLIPASDPLAAQLKLWHTDGGLARRFHQAMNGTVHRVVPPVEQLSAVLGTTVRPGRHPYIPDTEKTILLALTLAVFTAVFWAIVLGRPKSSTSKPAASSGSDAPASLPNDSPPRNAFVTPPARTSVDKMRNSYERSNSADLRDKLNHGGTPPQVAGSTSPGMGPRPAVGFGSSRPREGPYDLNKL
eukprot:jgi/Mesvir1/19388/Mv10423-RA.1